MQMNTDKKTTAFYERLKKQLNDQTIWPSLYMYKFIVPANLEKVAKIKAFTEQNKSTKVAPRLTIRNRPRFLIK